MEKKAQSTSEFIVLTAFILIIFGVISIFILDIPSMFINQNTDYRMYYADKSVGVLSLSVNGQHINVTLKNNLREPIMINHIYVNNVNLLISNQSIPIGDVHKFTSTQVTDTSGQRFSYVVAINYTLLRTQRDVLFNETEITFDGIVS